MNTLQDVDWDCWRAKDPATLMFVIDGREILLIEKKRGLGAGKINGPGGKLEHGESFLQCAVRECREEIGVTAVEPRCMGQHRFQFVDGYSIHVHVFVAYRYTGTPVETDEAVPLWFAVDAIPYGRMWADDALWLPQVIAGRSVSGDWIFDNDDIVDFRLDVTAARMT